MTTSKLDRLITEAAAAEPVNAPLPAGMVHLSQERLGGEVAGAYLFNGALLWWPLDGSGGTLPPGARALHVRTADRG